MPTKIKVEQRCLSSRRRAPRISVQKKKINTRGAKKRGVTTERMRITSHAKPVVGRYPPNEAMIQRIRRKSAQSSRAHARNHEDDHMDNKETNCKRTRSAMEPMGESVDPEACKITKWSKVQPQRKPDISRSGPSSKRKGQEDEAIERILKKAKGHEESETNAKEKERMTRGEGKKGKGKGDKEAVKREAVEAKQKVATTKGRNEQEGKEEDQNPDRKLEKESGKVTECRTILIGPACELTRCDQSWGNAKGTPTSSDSSNKQVAAVAASDQDHVPTTKVGKGKGKHAKIRKEREDKKAEKQGNEEGKREAGKKGEARKREAGVNSEEGKADGDKAKARKKDPAAPSLGIGDTKVGRRLP